MDVPSRGLFDSPRLLAKLEELTESLRREATADDKNCLWLYRNLYGKVCSLKAAEINLEVARWAETVGLSHGDNPIQLTYRRLRPTSLSEVVSAGGIEVAQRRAAHANPARTYAYASNPGNEVRLRDTALRAQSKAIASSTSSFTSSSGRDEVGRLAGELAISLGAAREILQGKRDKLFNACINDKNGAGIVRKGIVCGAFEACLVCQNAVILERHLVRLITYQVFWLEMRIEMSPEAWAEKHELNCAIIDAHLARFDEDVVAQHRADAELLCLKVPCFRLRQV
jgi:hypothetical protein